MWRGRWQFYGILFLCLSFIPPILAQYPDSCDVNGNSWIYHETIDYLSRKRIISSNSCPNHFNQCQESVCGGMNTSKAIRTDLYFEIPLYPVIAMEKSDTKCVNGTIGIALNGVSIESMSNEKEKCVPPSIGGQSYGDKMCDLNGIDDGTKVCGDAVQSNYKTFDRCGGHADDFGGYHYHIPPACLIHQMESIKPTMPSNHSPQIGWALDGFPIYGPIGPLGEPILPCTNPLADSVLCLDDCNGLYSALSDIDQYMYRYYVTGPVASDVCQGGDQCDKVEGACCADAIPTIQHRPYTLGCYRGCRIPLPEVDGQVKCLPSDQPGVTEDFYPEISDYPKEIYTSLDHLPPSTLPPTPSASPTPTSPLSPSPHKGYKGYGSTVVRYNPNQREIGRIQYNTSIDRISVELYEIGGRESYITGLASLQIFGPQYNDQILFTNQRGIFTISTDGTGLTEIIRSITRVHIKGYSLGQSYEDITTLTVQNIPCSNIFYENSLSIECLQTSLTGPIVVDDVLLTVHSTTLQGYHLQPQTIARSQSHRPVVSNITIQQISFLPYTVQVPVLLSSNDQIPSYPWIYWSDLSTHQIYRSHVNGKWVQSILQDVDRVYGLTVLEDSEASLHHIFFSHAANGCIGRITVTSQALKQDQYIPLTSYSTVSILLKDIEEPRGITVDISRGYLYLTTHYGTLVQFQLTDALQSSFDYLSSPSIRSSLPRSIRIIHQATTFSRYDGLSIIPSYIPTPEVPSWNEVPILVVDTPGNSVRLQSTDGFTAYELSLFDGFSIYSIIWPRTIVTTKVSSDILHLFIGEILGKIWKVTINLKKLYEYQLNSKSSVYTLADCLSTPVMVYDESDFDASITIRNLIQSKKYHVNRSELIYPDILD